MKFKSMLFRFYKNDPDDCHYLFGTMHLATDAAYAHAQLAIKYINKASQYAAEMDLNDFSQKDIMSYFKLPTGNTFSGFFRPKQYTKYRSFVLKSLKIDLDHYSEFTPFFINNLLAEISLKKTRAEALDHHLWQYALSLGIEMVGVESFDDQVNILKQIPMNYQVKSFRESVRNLSAFRKKLQNLNEMYRKGNLVQLYKSSKKSMGNIRKLMIYDRNVMMTQRIIHLSEKKTTFFAIGAAHLAGDKGIIAILKKKGYTVTAI